MKDLPHRPGALLLVVLLGWTSGSGPRAWAADQPPIPTETLQEAQRRHKRVGERRQGVDVICHRGASEHAYENTLEAFRATFALGGDGNEFDIRPTRDGVLVLDYTVLLLGG